MPFLHKVVVAESIEIKTSPAVLFSCLTSIVDDAGFKRLNADNISFCWLKGVPWAEGSIAYAVKYLHGKPHKFKFVISKVVHDRHIEYRPVSRLMRWFFPKKEFILEQTTNGCRFISSATFMVGWIGKKFFKKKIDDGLSSFRVYLQEEGKNLKKMLEE